jgi:hypothetical protein
VLSCLGRVKAGASASFGFTEKDHHLIAISISSPSDSAEDISPGILGKEDPFFSSVDLFELAQHIASSKLH